MESGVTGCSPEFLDDDGDGRGGRKSARSLGDDQGIHWYIYIKAPLSLAVRILLWEE